MNESNFLDPNAQLASKSHLQVNDFSCPISSNFAANPIFDYNRMKSWIIEQEKFNAKRELIADG